MLIKETEEDIKITSRMKSLEKHNGILLSMKQTSKETKTFALRKSTRMKNVLSWIKNKSILAYIK